MHTVGALSLELPSWDNGSCPGFSLPAIRVSHLILSFSRGHTTLSGALRIIPPMCETCHELLRPCQRGLPTYTRCGMMISLVPSHQRGTNLANRFQKQVAVDRGMTAVPAVRPRCAVATRWQRQLHSRVVAWQRQTADSQVTAAGWQRWAVWQRRQAAEDSVDSSNTRFVGPHSARCRQLQLHTEGAGKRGPSQLNKDASTCSLHTSYGWSSVIKQTCWYSTFLDSGEPFLTSESLVQWPI